MVRATHLTIGTADRIRLDANNLDASRNDDADNESGENESGENEVRQEVQVSVTYALGPEDTDLTALAEEKAGEVQRAHEAAWNRIGAFRGPSGDAPVCTCRAQREPAEDATIHDDGVLDEKAEDENDDPDDEPEGYGMSPNPPPIDPPLGGAVRGAWYMPGGSRSGNGTASPELPKGPDAEQIDAEQIDAEPVTGPQRILIRSRARKAGLSTRDLDTLLYQQFKVWRVERLSKAQAVSVLDALERDLREREMKEKNGTNDTNGPQASTVANGLA